MKARQNESSGSGSGEVKTESEVEISVSMHVDEETGRRYSYNEAAGQTQWLSNADEEDEATIEEQGESKQHNRKRLSFRKLVSDKDEVYYKNVETGEDVWVLPENGDVVL